MMFTVCAYEIADNERTIKLLKKKSYVDDALIYRLGEKDMQQHTFAALHPFTSQPSVLQTERPPPQQNGYRYNLCSSSGLRGALTMRQAECIYVQIYDWRLCGRSNDGLKWFSQGETHERTINSSK